MSTIIIITPPTKPQRATEGAREGYSMQTFGDPLTKKEQREILRALLKELREE